MTLDHLAKGTLTEDVEDEVAVLVVGLLAAQNVVDVEDVITILVVVAIVLDALGRLGEDTSGIARAFVLEVWIADAVGRGEVGGEGV